MFFRYSTNFNNNEQHRDMTDDEKEEKCESYSGSLCDRICNHVFESMKTLGIYDEMERIDLDLSFLRGYDYRIFYGENSGVERKKSIVEVWKKQCQRFSFSRIKKENAKEAAIAKTTSDKIKSQKIIAAVRSLGYDDDTIYYTLVDFLFKDNAFEKACGSNKYFWLSEFGDRAAAIIESNVKTGHYDKEGSNIDRFRCNCNGCGRFFTPKSLRSGNQQTSCSICFMNKNDKRRLKKETSKEQKLMEITAFLKENKYSTQEIYRYFIENNKKYLENPKDNVKITAKIAQKMFNVLGFEKESALSVSSIEKKLRFNS